ncbi:MAG: hypothetical protein M3O36_19510 [Myxococcota bacterium]|nr:hypothetical protein [Myxococcota bacterium]
MRTPRAPAFEERTVDELALRDERALESVGVYHDLKSILRRDQYVFRVVPRQWSSRWDRALFLNLTYWGGAGGDVVLSPRVAADVLAHAAWHHLAALALAGPAPSAEALFLGESVASAFDVYLVGQLLRRGGRSAFLETQVPAMAESARAAGLGARGFKALLSGIADDPERAFGDLRRLLYDATRALFASDGAGDAMRELWKLDSQRFAPLLHHYELSNWVLYGRAYSRKRTGNATKQVARVRAVDAALRSETEPVTWLTSQWVKPRLAGAELAGDLASEKEERGLLAAPAPARARSSPPRRGARASNRG